MVCNKTLGSRRQAEKLLALGSDMENPTELAAPEGTDVAEETKSTCSGKILGCSRLLVPQARRRNERVKIFAAASWAGSPICQRRVLLTLLHDPVFAPDKGDK